ncbi:MAG TPA: biotin/lipoyl-containing protein [Candidatus Limnocylindrales bacterium]|nr:biotin/lipoyl-containing protein [Candidatus Limnocylindrales bacterium]
MSTRRYTVSIGGRSYEIDVRETASDRFEVSVDGRTFEATLEGEREVAREAGLTPPMPIPAPALPGAMPRTMAPAPAPPGTGPADVVAAPLPGVVLEVLVKPGAVLQRGDPLLVLEAMKMRNTIRSPRNAVVVEVAVSAGQPVAPNDVLVRLADARA